MTMVDFLVTYFTSALSVDVFLVLLLTGTCLLLGLRLAKENPRRRSHFIAGIFLLLIFSWSFIPLSILFCGALFNLYETIGDLAVPRVLGLALLTSVIVALPISLLVSRRAPRLFLARLEQELSEPDAQIKTMLDVLSFKLGVGGVKLREVSSQSPLACTFGGRRGTIVISDALGRLLERDEMETVMAHELAHLKSDDSNVSILLSVYRKILFFDPALRALESRFHREREFAADEFSAFFTRKPLSLASALLKISARQRQGLGNLAVVSVVGAGWYQDGHQLKERVIRLIRIADRLEASNPGRVEARL